MKYELFSKFRKETFFGVVCFIVLPMPKLLSHLFLCLALAWLCGCRPQDPTVALREMSAQEHFAAARAAQSDRADLPLAIWHYEQFLSAETDPALLDVARIELSQCMQRLSQGGAETAQRTSGRDDMPEQLRLLKRRNTELENWVSRLNTENLALRQALLKAQEKGGSK